jgi:hypothetical protein
MKPVTVSVSVPNTPEEVWAFLDVLGNHECFTDHMLVDWECSGPTSGVGSRARMRLNKPGRPDRIDLEVIEVDPPYRSVEESVSGGGRRRTRGTYRLQAEPDRCTKVSFEFAWLEIPVLELLAAPLTRAIVRKGNRRSLTRLKECLDTDWG